MSAPAPRRRWLVVALVASVALNLFFAGLHVGRWTGEDTPLAQPGRRALAEVLAPLPAQSRILVRREVLGAMPEVRRELRAMQQARRGIAEELARPQPDAAALERHFRQVRVHTAAMQESLQQAFGRAAVQLPVEERRLLLEGLRQREAGGRIPGL